MNVLLNDDIYNEDEKKPFNEWKQEDKTRLEVNMER